MTKSLAAFLIKLRPLEPKLLKPYMGRAAHQFVLTVANRVMATEDPELSNWMHHASQGEERHRPYTVSGPFHSYGDKPDVTRGNITTTNSIWIRVTALHERVVKMLCTLQEMDPFTCEFDKAKWEVEGAIPEESDHPRLDSYEAIYQRYGGIAPREFEIKFLSSVVLRTRVKGRGDQYITLPIPSRLFGDLAERWNGLAPKHLHFRDYQTIKVREATEHFRKRVEQNVYVVECNIKASQQEIYYQFRRDNTPAKIGGFVGDARFMNVVERDDIFAREIAVLVDFAFFAGMGRETTVGMGLVRPSFLHPPMQSRIN